MEGNFDCTQFITFDSSISIDEIQEMLSLFERLGFEVIIDEKIKEIKKHYFKDYSSQYFIELKFDNFMGEFEEWKQVNKPPILINKFINAVEEIVEHEEITNLKIILALFAEEGRTTNEVVSVDKSQISNGLFIMSSYFFDVWVDNLILRVLL